jgi:hypothetical protein
VTELINSLIKHAESQIAWLRHDIENKTQIIVTNSKQKAELENKLIEQERRLSSLYAIAAKPESIMHASEN